MNELFNQLVAANFKAGSYTFSWIHILIALVVLFIVFKLIAFQIKTGLKLVITVAIIAAAVYYVYYA